MYPSYLVAVAAVFAAAAAAVESPIVVNLFVPESANMIVIAFRYFHLRIHTGKTSRSSHHNQLTRNQRLGWHLYPDPAYFVAMKGDVGLAEHGT